MSTPVRGFADAVGHGLVRRHAAGPLPAPVREPHRRGEHVPARSASRAGSLRETSPCGLTRMVSLPNLLPASPSACRKRRPACHRCRHCGSVSWPHLDGGGCSAVACRRAPHAPPRPHAVPSPLASLLPEPQGQPVSDRRDPGLEAVEARELTAPGQRPLIMAAFVIDPAHREEDSAVRVRLRSAHAPASCSSRAAQRALRSREASAPRWSRPGVAPSRPRRSGA